MKHSFMKQRSIYLSAQRLTTRGRPMMKCYASLIAVTRFHVVIKRVYIHLLPCTNNNAIHGSIIIRHSLCEPYTPKKRDDYGALTQNSHDRSSAFFHKPFYDGRNGIFYSKEQQDAETIYISFMSSDFDFLCLLLINYWLVP